MNANLAVYFGAYINKISNLAILDSNSKQNILTIIPYLKQMRINYRVYSDLEDFIQDKDTFCPSALISISDEIPFNKKWDEISNTLNIDVIIVTPKESISFENFEADWYSVVITNPNINQFTYLYHTNGRENIPLLKRLNSYQTICVE